MNARAEDNIATAYSRMNTYFCGLIYRNVRNKRPIDATIPTESYYYLYNGSDAKNKKKKTKEVIKIC